MGVARALRGVAGGLAALAAVGLAGEASAHHSFAMFDQNKQVSLVGTVKEFQFTNPHAFIEIITPNPDGGAPTEYSVELNSPNNLRRQGWKRDSLKPGDHATVVMNPLRDGKHGGLFVSATLPDGKVLGDQTKAGGRPVNVPVVQ